MGQCYFGLIGEATIYSLFDHAYKYMGDQLCAKKILNNHWISGVPILKGLTRLLKRLKFCLVNTETTVKIIWSSGIGLTNSTENHFEVGFSFRFVSLYLRRRAESEGPTFNTPNTELYGY